MRLKVAVLTSVMAMALSVFPAQPASASTALNKLDRKCTEGKPLLRKYAVVAQRLLANGGVYESRASIIRHVNKSIPPGYGPMKCSDIFAAYVTLRGGHV